MQQEKKHEQPPSHRECKSVSTQTDVPYPSHSTLISTKEAVSLWAQYLEANRRRPLLTKSLTTGVLTLFGNISAQYIMIQKGKQAHIMLRKVDIICCMLSLGFFSAHESAPVCSACSLCPFRHPCQVCSRQSVFEFIDILSFHHPFKACSEAGG